MDKRLLRAPLPRRDDDVALDALRPRRLVLGQLALGDAVGPIAEILERHAAELSGNPVRHELAGLSGGDAAHPRVRTGLELAELRRDGARRFLPELMAADAVDVTHALAPGLARDVLRDIGRAAEILLRRHFHHRVPVDRRIILRRRPLVGRRHRREIELLAGLGAHLRRVHQPIAAHPDLIVRIRQVRDDVAALIVGDDDLGIFGRQLGRLRDDPDPGFRAARTGDHAADVVIVDRDRRLLRVGRCRHGNRHRGDADCGNRRKQNLSQTHLVLPAMPGLKPPVVEE